jgi:type I restriction enzyme S subunit
MEVREGYKKTEVGVIPEDWDYICLGEISDIKTGPFGSALHAKDYVDVGTPIITVEHLGEYSIVHRNLPLVSNEDKTRLSSYILRVNDIVFSRVGSVDRNSIVTSEEDGWLFSGRLLRIRPDKSRVYPKYLSFHFHYEPAKQLIRNISVGQTMASLNTKLLTSFSVVLPPLPEQQAIATALSDMDNLINSLTKLIDKKKNIKQGAMQELLTGKRRLEGFSGEWEKKSVFEFGVITTGSTPSTSNEKYWGGGIPWITPTDINEKKNIYSSERKLTEYGLDAVRKLDANTVLITCIASLGKNAILRKNGACNQQINAITPSKDFNPDYIYYLFEVNKQYLISKAGITATSIVSKSEFSLMEFVVPPKLKEQTAIANILSDMDAEIEALEQKLSKFKSIKQGMMQELLTGRIRLI